MKERPVNIAVLASGSGSNAAALMAHFSQEEAAKVGRIAWVCTNRKEAGVRTRADEFGIAHSHVSREDIQSGRLDEELQARDIEWIALAGFLLRVPGSVCQTYEGRMVNIHPALLPNFGGEGMYGLHVHRAVHAAGELRSGMTIHWVNEAYDEGDIVFQGEVDLTAEDSPEEIAAKVLELEHRHYPTVLEGLIRIAQGTDVRDGTHTQSHQS
ncbi:MAG: phosphoribosylglycinamide formyltransferase [Bacteroidetes bacterium]|nr:phosphoribosylglycinamide formyltransferase [Bacteroidota bacterium]MDA1243234.1 phosphoribosylglycinamide formyltransferase [Bacteroidota bacterium]